VAARVRRGLEALGIGRVSVDSRRLKLRPPGEVGRRNGVRREALNDGDNLPIGVYPGRVSLEHLATPDLVA